MCIENDGSGCVYNFHEESGIAFWISSDCPKPDEVIRSVLMPIEKSGYVYASTKRKDIYLGFQKSCFVKKYKLPGLYRKLHGKQYAPREFLEISEVRKRGIGTPRVLAYFEIKLLKYLNIMNGVCIEYADATRAVNLEEQDKIVSCVVDLYRKGIFHSDFNPMNILTSDTMDYCIPIDFIGSYFSDAPIKLSLILNIARFIQFTKLKDEAIQTQLLEKIILNVPDLLAEGDINEIRKKTLKFSELDLSNDKIHHILHGEGMKSIFDYNVEYGFLK